jgi:hypothetical protein
LLAPVLWNSNVAVFAMICGNVREPSFAAKSARCVTTPRRAVSQCDEGIDGEPPGWIP